MSNYIIKDVNKEAYIKGFSHPSKVTGAWKNEIIWGGKDEAMVLPSKRDAKNFLNRARFYTASKLEYVEQDKDTADDEEEVAA